LCIDERFFTIPLDITLSPSHCNGDVESGGWFSLSRVGAWSD
jgi:hypothetical protein